MSSSKASRPTTGSEFPDHEVLERSGSGGTRTYLYYALPYSSWERGSCENANRMIRRFISKDSNISQFTGKRIQTAEVWINNSIQNFGF